jgi:hypothetical protein
MTQPESVPDPNQLRLFDSLAFRLTMDGLYASIKLHEKDPTRGVTKEQAEESLKRWFPEFPIELNEPEE